MERIKGRRGFKLEMHGLCMGLIGGRAIQVLAVLEIERSLARVLRGRAPSRTRKVVVGIAVGHRRRIGGLVVAVRAKGLG